MVAQAYWQFHCPECGFGDAEHGHLLSAHDIYCLVCMEEDGRRSASIDGRSSKSKN
jgi:hypothetical protein